MNKRTLHPRNDEESHTFGVRVPVSINNEIERRANRQSCSKAYVVRMILFDALRRDGSISSPEKVIP